MKLLFQNSRGEERVIAEPQNREEIIVRLTTITIR